MTAGGGSGSISGAKVKGQEVLISHPYVLGFFVIGVVVGVVVWTICGYAGTICWVTSTIAGL